MDELLKVLTNGGVSIMVNISDEACLKLGFKHGAEVIDPNGDRGIIAGVAPNYQDKDALWYYLPDVPECAGCVSHWDAGNLREQGFRFASIQGIPTNREERFCFQVIGRAGAHVEEVIVADSMAAVDQDTLFKLAGYADVRVLPVSVLFDEDGDAYTVQLLDGPVVVNAKAVPATYSRRDINPGISVYDYDREVRKLKPTSGQIVMAAIGVLAAGGMPGFLGGMIFIAMYPSHPRQVGLETMFVVMLSLSSCMFMSMASSEKLVDFGRWFAGIPSRRKK